MIEPTPAPSSESDSSTSQAWELVADGGGAAVTAGSSTTTTMKDADNIEARLVACMAAIESARTALSNGEATAAIDAYLVETMAAIHAVRAVIPLKSDDDGINAAAAVPPNSSFTTTGGIGESGGGADDDDDDDNDATSEISDIAIASNFDLREEAAQQYTRSFSLPPLSPHTYADSTISDIHDMDDVNAAPGHLRSLSHIPEARLRGLSRGLSSSSLRSIQKARLLTCYHPI
jgi:hypothetical protein